MNLPLASLYIYFFLNDLLNENFRNLYFYFVFFNSFFLWLFFRKLVVIQEDPASLQTLITFVS
jgi:hypothetical protein